MIRSSSGLSYRRARSGKVTGVRLEGPFFEADLGKTLDANVHDYLERFAALGEELAKARASGAPRRTAGPSYSASFIRGRVGALSGRQWKRWAMVSADTSGLTREQAIRVQAALAGRHDPIANEADGTVSNIGTTPGHEGTARVFRATATDLRRLVRGIDLTKGLS